MILPNKSLSSSRVVFPSSSKKYHFTRLFWGHLTSLIHTLRHFLFYNKRNKKPPMFLSQPSTETHDRYYAQIL